MSGLDTDRALPAAQLQRRVRAYLAAADELSDAAAETELSVRQIAETLGIASTTAQRLRQGIVPSAVTFRRRA